MSCRKKSLGVMPISSAGLARNCCAIAGLTLVMGWRKLFDAGHTHSLTNERRLDGSMMWVEGDYMCFYDATGRITGHFGIQRDVSDRVKALEELEQSRAELRALAARLQATREEIGRAHV